MGSLILAGNVKQTCGIVGNTWKYYREGAELATGCAQADAVHLFVFSRTNYVAHLSRLSRLSLSCFSRRLSLPCLSPTPLSSLVLSLLSLLIMSPISLMSTHHRSCL